MAVAVSGNTLVTAGLDDAVRMTTPLTADSLAIATKLEKAPRDLAVAGDISVVASVDSVVVFRAGAKVATVAAPWETSSVAINNNGSIVAVGGKDNKIHIFALAGNTLTAGTVISATGSVDAVSFSPNGQRLAAGDSNRNVFLYNVAGKRLYPSVLSPLFLGALTLSLPLKPTSPWSRIPGNSTQPKSCV